MRNIVIQLLFVLFAMPLLSAKADATWGTGNWWNNLTKTEKLVFIEGYWQGKDSGAALSGAVMITSVPSGKPGAKTFTPEQQLLVNFTKHVTSATVDLMKSRSKGVTNGDLVDGVDTLFADFKNRRLTVSDAMDVVYSQISGSSAEAVESMLAQKRKDAGVDQ